MKTSPLSTAAFTQAMRHSLLRVQNQLTQAQKEVSTGRVADVGLALGARTAQTLTFARDLERMNTIVDSNALAAARLSATQDSLSQIADAAQTFLSTLTGAASGDAGDSVTLTSARATLDALTSILNTSLNGEHLFAGINTDVQPLDSFSAPGSTAKAAFDAAFLAHFGFTQNAAAAANITTAQMDTFITTALEPQFMGAGWQANWSSATDTRITSRIALNETTETSVTANHDGMRKLAMAAATITDLFDSNISAAAKTELINRAVAMVGESIADLSNLQAQVGIAEQRVSNASDRIRTQVDLFERHISTLEGVDPYEASTRVATLLAQLETSYALTARIQQLSLIRLL